MCVCCFTDPLTEMITDRNKLQFVTTIQWLWMCGVLVWMTDASMVTATTQTSVHRQPKQFQMLSHQQATNDSPPANQEAAAAGEFCFSLFYLSLGFSFSSQHTPHPLSVFLLLHSNDNFGREFHYTSILQIMKKITGHNFQKLQKKK